MFDIDSDTSLTGTHARINLFFNKSHTAGGPPTVDIHEGFVVLKPFESNSQSIVMFFDDIELLRQWASSVLTAAAEPRDRRERAEAKLDEPSDV